MKPPWERPRRGSDALLPVASAAYGLAIQARRAAYALGLLPRRRVGVPVLCVGNLTVGGTGKTPAVIALAKRLQEWGRRPAVVSRGYRADKDKTAIVLVDPAGADWRAAGDEPLLIARSLPGVPVLCGADRAATAERAIAETQADVVVLDDGFQHWRLHRDLDIVLLDGTDPFGNGKLLPAGPLREPLRALHRAGLVVITKANLADEAGVWAQRLANRLGAPVVQAIHRPVRLWDLTAGQGRSIEELRGRRVMAVSGLARNETFPALLRSLGAVIEAPLGFGDHQDYGAADWAMIRRVFAESGAEWLVTTAKDAVKWTAEEVRGLPVAVLEIGFEVTHGAEKFWNSIRQILA